MAVVFGLSTPSSLSKHPLFVVSWQAYRSFFQVVAQSNLTIVNLYTYASFSVPTFFFGLNSCQIPPSPLPFHVSATPKLAAGLPRDKARKTVRTLMHNQRRRDRLSFFTSKIKDSQLNEPFSYRPCAYTTQRLFGRNIEP